MDAVLVGGASGSAPWERCAGREDGVIPMYDEAADQDVYCVGHPDVELFANSVHAQAGLSYASCHVPVVEREDGSAYRSHDFGGSNKNIGIGCASGREGKKWIHTTPGSADMWDIKEEEMGERFTESAKATVDHFGQQIVYVNAMRNMSVSCDCEGVHAQPVVTPNVGILSSTDICAIDQACVDIVYVLPEKDRHDLVERMESCHGLGQLSYMQHLGMGNRRYVLVDIDNGDVLITAAGAAAAAVPFEG